ncbi:MAG: thiazole synthase [Desulfobulbaceae bacterium A2]|nr:MAG: thiazole synthase [Desulfobulbaceae bacterium A2]
MLVIAGKKFHSRLFVGTGKFSSLEIMRRAITASGSEMVTVALRRVELERPQDDLLAALDQDRVTLLPNTSGARNAAEAVRLARLARAASGSPWLKLEVTPDPRTLLPDPVDTLQATETLAAEGFIVLPYINADPILALRLQDVGAAAVMPLGAPIGTNLGLTTLLQLRIIVEQARVPVVVDAGIGAPSHAAAAMELGAAAVLVNTAIAVAGDPVRMAHAFKIAVEAGREAHLAGLGRQSAEASPSSPLEGHLGASLDFLQA